jgi:peptidyl-prolyl cis-trans isomerase C
MHRSALFTLLSFALAAQTPPPVEAPKKEAPKTETAPQTAKPVEPAKPAEAAKPVEAKKVDKIIAIVGKERVFQSEVDEAIAGMPAQQRMQVEMSPNGRDQYMQMYVNNRLLAAKARKDGLDKTVAFKKKVQQAQEQLLAFELLNRDGEALRAKMVVKDEDLKAYFEKNQDKFKTPDTFSARHILVAVKAATATEKAVTDEEAKAKVAKIQEELKKGRKLEELAKEYTDDPGSKDKGGLYEDFNPAQMVTEFAEAVRTQEIGKVGPPVKTQFGYHIIEVTKKNPGKMPTFDETKEQVRSTLMPELQEKVFKAYLEKIQLEIPMIVGPAAESAAKMMGGAAAPTAKKPAKGGTAK